MSSLVAQAKALILAEMKRQRVSKVELGRRLGISGSAVCQALHRDHHGVAAGTLDTYAAMLGIVFEVETRYEEDAS